MGRLNKLSGKGEKEGGGERDRERGGRGGAFDQEGSGEGGGRWRA